MKVIAFIGLMLFGTAYAECNQFYPNEKKIVIPNTIELCNSFFVTVYDPVLKSPVFSSEIIKAVDVDVERTGSFKSDKRLPNTKRAENGDYIGNGFDRGHLVPAADAQTDIDLKSTFLLSNMVPQSPKLNRGQWKKLEGVVRKGLSKDTIILTGVIFYDGYQTIGKNKIPVPGTLYKIVYNIKPDCYVADNRDAAKVQKTNCNTLEKMVGFKI